jgi:general secretion pathway protein D
MKTRNILPFLLLAALTARAEDPAPIPPNPFGNLPANEEGSFSPFEEDFEGVEDEGEPFNEGAPAGAQRPGFVGGNPMPGAPRPGGAPGFPARGGVNAPPGGMRASGGNPANPRMGGTSKIEPANCKELVENFDYPDAEILDVAKAIAKLTGKNFIYNPQDIKGRISVVSQTQITVCDAWNAFLTSLNMRGFALVPSGKYLRIERIANAKEKQTPIYAKGKPPNNDEFITRVIPLRYIDATEFEQAFRLWMPREARMQAYGQTNTIIITDTASHINRMVELINLLDVAGYQESLVVVPIKNATAKEIAKLVEQILNSSASGSSSAGGFGVARPQAGYVNPATRNTGRRGRSGGSSISKIIADDRTNSLIVKANAAGILEIRALVRRLDQKVAASEGSGRIHVIRLQFADAETLAKTLQQITGGGTTRTNNRTFPTFGQAAPALQGEIKVAPDKATQSLVITASPADFATMKKVVENLDVPRDQVFIEAMIMEIRLNRDDAFGTSFVSAPNGIALTSASDNLTSLLLGNPLAAGGFALGFKKGVARKFTVGSGDSAQEVSVNSLNGLLELIQGNSDSNVVATPKIIALDNEEAIFEISDEIKIESQNTNANGTTSTSFTPDKAQTILKVTPQINKASNFVRLNIDQKLENFDQSNVPTSLRTKTQGKNTRSTNTKVIVQNEDTVVLSGLIRDSVVEDTRKVPLLGDIPVLGWLFKNTRTTVKKTNLLVFITPSIIKQYDQIRKVLNRNLDERDDFVRENLGSKDPFGRHLSNMKKNLPDLTVIEPLPQKREQESTSFYQPSAPDREYQDEDYYDPNSYYYPPEGVPLSPIDNVPPGIEMPPPIDDGSPAPPVVPANPDDGMYP